MLKRIRDFLARVNAARSEAKKPPVLGRGGDRQQHPVTQYVRAMLTELGRNKGVITLSPDTALPVCDGIAPSRMPTYEQVTNRLKVLAGIPPMHLPEPLDTEITHSTHLGEFRIRIHCDDGVPANCRLSATTE